MSSSSSANSQKNKAESSSASSSSTGTTTNTTNDTITSKIDRNRLPAMKTVNLFGGHFTIQLPQAYYDLSELRQIPDHQEVHADTMRDHSVIVELVESNDDIPNDELLNFHWMKLCQATSCAPQDQKILQKMDLTKEQLGNIMGDFKACCLGIQKIAKARETAKNTVLIFFTVIKLKKYDTEILVSMNLPILVDIKSSTWYEGRETAMPQEDQEYWFRVYRHILSTLELKDDSLFV